MDIISYETFKRRYKPSIWQVRDGIKGWAIQTVTPTLQHHGWKVCEQEFDYRLCLDEKPKHMAQRLVLEQWGEEWTKDKKFVYYLYMGTNGYMDVLYVYWKYKHENNVI